MSKVTIGFICIIFAASYFTYSSYISSEKLKTVNSDMALSYLAHNQKWIEQTDQLRAINRGQFTVTSVIIGKVGADYISDGKVEDKGNSICYTARYQWNDQTRENPTLLDANKCY
ncbi:hypothetical protein F0241_02285 [Vibrio kanaloae]|nr:hypothetical protein [Vibrio kanaloae]MCG9558827.1 hypothetical protein [Vibrio kanaloae]NOH99950.1 hypothetical protein [Vibrio kanaloae]TKE98651.1 hypothetical protein FCV46_20020 [Vibrio kanaloae]TKF59044.1 hypothetical protein FCV51_15615 [Vibrio kanaloae]UIJ42307.1 hypothetical protein LWM38_18045 [Vibrio kanaloae]